MRRTKRIVLRTQDKPPPRPAPEPVIVETFADGFIQVYAAPHVRIAMLNHFADEGGPALHNTIDEFHALELPRSHRRLYNTRRIRAMGQVKRRTIEGEARRRWELNLLRGYREAAELLRDGKAAP